MSIKWTKLSQSEEKVGYKYVTTKIFQMPDGQKSDFTTWNQAGSRNVATIALTPDNEVIIARQFRAGPERVLDELPGGGVEVDEDLAVAAARELQEETGYMSGEELVYLGTTCRDAYTNETDNYFLALNCKQLTSQNLDDGEYVEITLISIEQLLENAKSAKMSDPGGVLLAYDKLLALLS